MSPIQNLREAAHHQSLLLAKAESLHLEVPDDLRRLAIERGCNYYSVEPGPKPVGEVPLTNAELAVTLLSPELPFEPWNIRIGAAIMSASDVQADELVRLARSEKCESMVRYIAESGKRYEPANESWDRLLSLLADVQVNRDGLPHPTRFIDMTGIIRGKIGLWTQWIRPGHSPIIQHR